MNVEQQARMAASLPLLYERRESLSRALDQIAALQEPKLRREAALQLGLDFPEIRAIGFLLELALEQPERARDFIVLRTPTAEERVFVQGLLDRFHGDRALHASLREVMPGSFPLPLGPPLQPLKARLRALGEQLTLLGDRLRALGYPEQAKPVHTLAGDCRSFAFRVFVIGEWSSGKSTLLNALLGQELLPTGFEPVTPTATTIRFGERRRLLLRRRGEDLKEQPFDLLHALALSVNVGPVVEDDWLRDIEEICVEVPAELCASGIEFVDTPGLNDPGQQATLVADLLPRADAVILVLRANQALTGVEQGVLQQAKVQPPPLRRWLDAGLAVFTFTDVVRQSRTGTERVRQRAETLLRELHPPDGFAKGRRYWINAQGALLTKLGENASEDPSFADFQRLERELQVFLADEYSGKTEALRRRQALHLSAQAKQLLCAEQISLQQRKQLSEEDLSSLAQQIDDVGSKGRRIASELEAKAHKFVKERGALFSHHADAMMSGVADFILSLKYPGIVGFNPRKAGEFFTDRSQRWLQEEQRRWYEQDLAPAVEHFLLPFRQDLTALRKESESIGEALLLPEVVLGPGPEAGSDLIDASISRTYLSSAVGGIVGMGVGVAAAMALALPVIVPFGLIVGVLSGLLSLVLRDDGLQQRARAEVVAALKRQLPGQMEELKKKFTTRLQDHFIALAGDIQRDTSMRVNALNEQLHQRRQGARMEEQQRVLRMAELVRGIHEFEGMESLERSP